MRLVNDSYQSLIYSGHVFRISNEDFHRLIKIEWNFPVCVWYVLLSINTIVASDIGNACFAAVWTDFAKFNCFCGFFL